jgi:hypothetical protein
MAQPITLPRWLKWTGIGLAALIGLLVIVAFVIDEPVRGYIEKQVNDQLKGYRLHIGKLDLHPLTMSVDLEDVTFIQTRNPEPPMARVPKWHASVQLTQLVQGKVVSDHVIERPAVHVTRPQAKSEAQESRQSTWQDTVRQLFPLEITVLKVQDAEITYFDHPKAQPLELSAVQVEAKNISNRGPEQDYPSTIHVEAQLFEEGHLTVDGTTNFLAKPFLGVNIDFNLARVPVQKLVGVTGRYNLILTDGVLDADGRAEYSPWNEAADIRNFVLDRLKGDYVYRSQPTDKARRAEAVAAAKTAKKKSDLVVMVKHGKVLNSELGFVNKSAKPDYRVFVTDLNAEVDNFSNELKRLQGGDAAVKVTGRFMGTGQTVLAGTFRPEKPDPDFDLDVRIVKTQLKSFNDVLRAYADLDLSKGAFSFFSELSIRNGQVNGYVKPMFKDVEAYDPAQDKDKALTQKAYEAVVGGVADLLKSREGERVAIETDVTGPVPNPRASTWQIVGTLIQNAFFKALLPELEKEYGKA